MLLDLNVRSVSLNHVSSRPALKVVFDPALLAHLVPAQRLEQGRGVRSPGIAAIDELLRGGWPRAAVGELSGRRSSGRTAVLYASLARALAAGEAVALVDATGALDPRAAAACGIALGRLLWIRCADDPTAQKALRATDLVLAAGGMDLVALDLGDARPRVPTAAWLRLKHGAEKQGTTVLVSALSRTVGAFATAAVELAGGAPQFLTDGPPLFQGLRVQALRGRGGTEKNDGGRGQGQGGGGSEPCASLVFLCRS
jgi:hypothetical protein